MDDNPELQLREKIKHFQETVSSLLEEYESLLQKQNQTTTGDSDHSVKTPLINDVTKRLKEIDLALESIQQQLKLALEQYLHTQPDLPSSVDHSAIQSVDNQKQIAKVTINQQVGLPENEADLNPTDQILFNGTLPDDFYLHLISVIGIQECLLSNRLVCSLWNELVLERCHNQKSLKLFENFCCLMKYGEFLLKYEKTDDTSLILKPIGDDLLFEGLEAYHFNLFHSQHPEVIWNREKKEIASYVLTTFFPKIEQLVLCNEYFTFINIEHLLQFYAGQLTSLTMTDFDVLNYRLGFQLRDLSFPLLKSLNTFNFDLEIDNLFEDDDDFEDGNLVEDINLFEDDQLLSLLPQLESLILPSTKMSLETLLRTGTQLRELNINCIKSLYSALVDKFSKRSPINNNLRKFSFVYTRYFLQSLEFISLNLTSLESLKLNIRLSHRDNLHHLHSLIPYLVPLHQLNALTLMAPVSFFLLDDKQFAEIKPLPSVRHLKLELFHFYSLSIDLFSRSLFAAFPNVEQILIAFGIDGRVDAATMAAFEDFASKHSNVVQLFRSKNISKFTKLPNIVAPLLGHHRQVYEEYIEEEELFGMAICKLAASLVVRQGEDRPNLKIILRPADRLTALSNLFQLLESNAFVFTLNTFDKRVYWMKDHLVKCALKYTQSEGALFTVTIKCVLSLLGCSTVKNNGGERHLFMLMLRLVEYYQKQQFKEEDLLLLIHNFMDKLIKEMFNTSDFEYVINSSIRENLVYRVETVRALLRVCNSSKNCFRSF